jgi:hypothetical protein
MSFIVIFCRGFYIVSVCTCRLSEFTMKLSKPIL